MAIERQGWGKITEGLGAPIRKALEARSGKPTIVEMANGLEHVVYDVAWGRDAGDLWEHVTANCSPPARGREVHFFFLSEVVRIVDPDSGETVLEQQPEPGAR